tara:strand:+ start:794 stop:1111 length:318 start_codon:yes stop_codon:yes gene_type:complete
MAKQPKYRPTEVMIGGHKFSIEYKQMDDFGVLHFERRTISIRKNLSEEDTLDTILHEVVHACFALSGIGYLLDNDNLEEALVRAVENLVVPTFKKEHTSYLKQKK